MLGYDILLDTNLKPHLIGKIFFSEIDDIEYLYFVLISEINTIPSLAAKPDTIDSFVKNPLV